ncbi:MULTISPECIES: disulfide bond formation protein B [Chlamydia]|uniref:Probable disulfide formation protein n=1 Tax=Chlamydophila parapsittaci TaxID=344886 RepID=A0ABX5VWJ7_9CHLA|nr:MULTISPECIES: disulfide bond formation protein B [Chlamydia]AFS20711.1 disulfide bond formation DsbB family protein [Chlamydia psittaci GR9]QDE36819.1 disulfide bond formation protein B [Chlamydophila parapsittaci]QHE18481.1 disulfide bond formation protein B [Chlamydia psittaci]UOB76201.1 disulfide bond formation protein B [Chlamydia psittaci]USB81635.1 disulfide bond formation protein B [Chlamydia psittaci]
MIRSLRNYALYFAWLISCTGTVMSIYYSYLLNIEPCVLCYYQRICLFPLSVILGIATYREDDLVKMYALPLSIMGMLIAVYQICLQEIAGMTIDICGRVSCSTKLFIFGFITIPMASALAFCAISCLLILSESKKR